LEAKKENVNETVRAFINYQYKNSKKGTQMRSESQNYRK
jgi:hypothetical protein